MPRPACKSTSASGIQFWGARRSCWLDRGWTYGSRHLLDKGCAETVDTSRKYSESEWAAKLNLRADLDGTCDFAEALLVAARDVLRRRRVSCAVDAVMHVNYSVRLDPRLREGLADTCKPVNDCPPVRKSTRSNTLERSTANKIDFCSAIRPGSGAKTGLYDQAALPRPRPRKSAPHSTPQARLSAATNVPSARAAMSAS